MLTVGGLPSPMPENAAPAQLPDWLDLESRKAERVRIGLAAELFGNRTERTSVRVLDLTSLGCRVAAAPSVSVGAFVTVAIPYFTDISAWVAWSKKDELGLDFANPLPSRVVEHVIGLSARQSAV